MKLNLDENMKGLLVEVINNAIQIATEAKDDELVEDWNRIKKIVNQSHYRKLTKDDMDTVFGLADSGERVCDFLLENADTPEKFEKTNEIKDLYKEIKNRVLRVTSVKQGFIQ
jgi:predicted nucleotidyltransferase